MILLSILCSCDGIGSYDKKLVEIDSLTLKDPNRAISYLEAIKPDVDDMSKNNQMYYRLLCIKANDKAYVEHQTDSGVVELVEYFENHDNRKLAETYYYAGSVYRDLHDAPQAVAYFQKTVDALPKNEVSVMKSNAYYQCGNLFHLQNLKTQAVDILHKSFYCDSVMNDTIRMIESLNKLALSNCIIIKKTSYNDSVFPYLHRAMRLAEQMGNEKQIAIVASKFAYVYSYMNDYEHVANYLPKLELFLKNNDDFYIKMNYSYMMARRFVALKHYDAALPYCEVLYNCDYLDYKRYASQFLFKIYSVRNDYAKATYYLDKYEHLTDSLMVDNASNATAQASALYNYQLRERDLITLKNENQSHIYSIFIFATLCVMLFLVLCIYRINRKQKEQKLRQQVSRLSQLEKSLRKQNDEYIEQTTARINDLKKKLEDSENRNSETIKLLESERSELEFSIRVAKLDVDKQRLIRTKLFESDAHDMLEQRLAKDKALKDSDYILLDQTVNTICEGFKSTLYGAYNLSNQDYHICLLLRFGLSAGEISRLISRSNGAISQARKRMFIKIFGRDGSANDFDNYIQSL